MNYGLTLMARGDYDNAEDYFIKAHKKSPNWYTIKINLAILYGAKGNKKEAEKYFNEAINLNSSAPDPEYYYEGDYFSGFTAKNYARLLPSDY